MTNSFYLHVRQVPLALLYVCTFAVALLLGSCQSKNSKKVDDTGSIDPQDSVRSTILFDADSAYRYIAHQVSFGPRVPGTEAWQKCSDWLQAQLEQSGAKVILQKTQVKSFDGKMLPCHNIIGVYNEAATRRILLAAHWDSRPFADQDSNTANHNKPISGADDGASGVGVLLELARQWGLVSPAIGIDIVLFDVEDYGSSNEENSWCLGSDYWAKNPHTKDYKAEYGILLDMVGAKEAKFYWEGFSCDYAPMVVSKIWDKAASLGYGKYFVHASGGYLTDDHVPVQRHRNIRIANIVNYDPGREKGFGHYWHTMNDNMDIIDRQTLEAVGKTVKAIIDEEKQ